MRHDLFRFSGGHVPDAAILIARYGAVTTHTGIIFREEGRGLHLIDFHLDGRVVVEWWSGQHPHVIPNVDDDALANLASLCRVMAGRYRNRPAEHLYGLRRSKHAYVNPVTGDLYLGDTVGATCASFVLIVLEVAVIELVVTGADWPHRADADDQRHEGLVRLLEKHFPNPDYLARVRAELPCPRVAPQEVAGAAMCPNPPADQAFCERAASWVMELFDHNARHGV